jgi:hypothetical protein
MAGSFYVPRQGFAIEMVMPADILLVEGTSHISTAIKYLTQSTWSHSALYVGEYGRELLPQPGHCFVEADLLGGVRSVGIDTFTGFHTRICRPVGLSEADRRSITDFAIGRIGHRYDLKNVSISRVSCCRRLRSRQGSGEG